MKKKSSYIALCLASCLTSCIYNDVPYPLVVPKIVSIDVPGATKVDISAAEATVTLILDDVTDIQGVQIENVVTDPPTTRISPSMVGVYDLTKPAIFTLTTYQDYIWRVIARQSIERRFSVRGQVGSSVIDIVNHRVVAYVSKSVMLSEIEVQEMVLGPEPITQYSVDKENLRNFLAPVTVEITCHGRTEIWTLYVEQTETSVEFKSIDAWTRVAYLSASGIEGEERWFEYRKKGEEAWIRVPKEEIVVKAGDFSTELDGLEPLTSYECCAVSGTERTEPQEFTTDPATELPNGSFEVYSKAESSKYYSFYDPAHALWNSKWWDSGNIGSTSVGETHSICNPDKLDKVDGENSVRMNSDYVVVKFAAGNIFTGEFAEILGTSGGKVNFGRPWTTRPRYLRFALKYQPGLIDNINGYPANAPVNMGDPDRGQVYIALGDWDYRKYGGTPESPVQVNTTIEQTYFNPKAENVIAYGSYIAEVNTNGWIDVEIPLEYVSTSRKPTHIIISCASSMLGDYFTGSSTSTMWLDRMELVY